jgi:uncharacterized protein
MESVVKIECDNDIELEGIFNKKDSNLGAIICHPHPLYGGDMNNPVVMTIAQTFYENNFSTLRFNFRGAGNSTGTFDDGKGEQDDIRSALTFLRKQGISGICLSGYSFGSRMNASVVEKGCNIKDHIMVSPPAGFMSFDDIEHMPNTGLIIVGDNDDIAPVQIIEDHIKRWQINPDFEVIENCDHFYSGSLSKLNTTLSTYLSNTGWLKN